ncbi:MAG: hypothetical protein VX871_04855 [Pseudomonadota bacterium]|nr:hypothetical protein [Pseudomonadota bacterium]
MPNTRFLPLLAAFWLLIAGACAEAAEKVITVATPRGTTVNVLLTGDEASASANIMLLVGGAGWLRLDPATPGTRSRNFLARSRVSFAMGRYLVATVDSPSDRQNKDGLDGFRMTAEHAADLAAVASALQALNQKPVFIVGTSRGSVSAGNAAIRIDPALVNGAVLSSTLTDKGKRPDSLKEMDMTKARMPVFFVHNSGDQCKFTLLSSVRTVQAAMKKAGATADLAVLASTRADEDNPCEALTPHGYLGIEQEAVGTILAWVKARL